MAGVVVNAAAAVAAGAVAMVGGREERRKSGGATLVEGWVMKRSKNLHVWRARWLTLYERQGPSWALETSADLRGSAKHTVEVDHIFHVHEVDEQLFGRPHCFLVEFSEGSEPVVVAESDSISHGGSGLLSTSLSTVFLGRSKTREIYFQASSSDERDRWVASLEKALADTLKAAEEKAAALKAAVAAAESAPKGQGKGKKGAPPPPKSGPEGSKGKGKGKSNGKGQDNEDVAPVLPFGKKINKWVPAEKRNSAEATGGTVFDGLLEGNATKVTENIKALDSVFRRASLKGKAPPDAGKDNFLPKLKGLALLPLRDAQNIAIVLRCMPVKGPELAAVLESLLPGPCKDEELQRLAAVLPTPEQFRMVSVYDGPETELRDVERQLRPLADMQRLPQRMRALRSSSSLEEKQELLAKSLNYIQMACNELRASRTLRLVFAAVLVMFNYVNYGKTGATEAQAFDTATLLHLDQFEAGQGPFKNFNGLHFVASRLLLDGSGVTAESLNVELASLQKAAQVSLSEIQASINLLKGEAEFLYAEKALHPTAYGGDPPTPPPLPTPPEEPQEDPTEGLERTTSKRGPVRVGKSRGNILKDMRNYFREKEKQLFHVAEEEVREPPPPPPGTPPPAVLMMGNPEQPGTWRRVAVEVSTPGVLLLGDPEEDEGGQMASFYAVVAGAEVVEMSSQLASLEARGEALEATTPPCPFELQGVCFQGDLHAKKRLWLAAEDAALAQTWFTALSALALTPGAGFLWVKDLTFGVWRWRWAMLCDNSKTEGPEEAPDERLLVWHRTPGELLRKEQPINGITVGVPAEVHTFAASGHVEASRCPHGFRVFCKASAKKTSAKEVQFSASSRADLERWLHALKHEPSGAKIAEEAAAAAAKRKTMEDIFAFIARGVEDSTDASDTGKPKRSLVKRASLELMEDSDVSTATRSCSSSASGPEEEDGPPQAQRRKTRLDIPLYQLGLTAHRVDTAASQLSQSLDTTTAECRSLLAFFRQQQQDASLQLLSQQVQAFFSTFRTFSMKLKQSFVDIARHREACKRRGQPDPFAVGDSSQAKSKGDDKEWAALSLFGLQAPQGGQAGQRPKKGLAWQTQLGVKKAAKAAVSRLVQNSLHNLCAKLLVERAALQALGMEAPTWSSCMELAAAASEVAATRQTQARAPARPGGRGRLSLQASRPWSRQRPSASCLALAK